MLPLYSRSLSDANLCSHRLFAGNAALLISLMIGEIYQLTALVRSAIASRHENQDDQLPVLFTGGDIDGGFADGL